MAPSKRQLMILIVDDERDVLDALSEDIQNIFNGAIQTESCLSAAEALEFVKTIEPDSCMLAVVITDYVMPEMNGLNFLRELREVAVGSDPFRILLSGQADFESVKTAINEHLVDRCLSKPWQATELYNVLKDLLSQYLLTQAFEQVEHYEKIVSHSHYRQALASSEQKRANLAQNLWTLQQSLIAPRKFTDSDLSENLKNALLELKPYIDLDQVLRSYNEHELIFEEGQQLSSMLLIINGEVSHHKRELTESGHEEIFCEGPGTILGSMAHFSQGEAFTTVRAKTKVDLVSLSHQLLEKAMASSFDFTIYFTNILLRQVMRRIRHNVSSNVTLARTLDELKAAQLQLVESEKLATLGQLVAGIAHELNNPTAAIIRSVDHLATSLESIISQPSRADMQSLMVRSFERGFQLEPLSTRDIRQNASVFQAHLQDPLRAKRLAEMGYKTPAELGLDHPDEEQAVKFKRIDELTSFFQTGKFLRNITSCSKRIESLVRSLKSYARPESQQPEWCDLHVGIEESILILHNRLKRVELNKDYGKLPALHIWPGEINQIWTNLLSNALDAVHEVENPKINIRSFLAEKEVIVEICDNGHGIAPDQIRKVFEINFTTKKHGHYGLGLGLAICKKIAAKHHGDITVRSELGRYTCFSVHLPLPGDPTHAISHIGH